jgi:hypothetical protein
MREPSASTVIAMGVTVVFAAALQAQVSDTVLGTRLVASGALARRGQDTLRVNLTKNSIYRIAIWPASAQITVFASAHKGLAIFAPRVREGDARHVTAIEIYPQSTGVFVIVPALHTQAGAERVWIWEDSAAEIAARAKSASRWHVGIGGEWIATSPYAIARDSERIASSYPAPVLILTGRRLGLVTGFGNENRGAEGASLFWVFLEIRYTLFTLAVHRHALDIRAMMTLAQGTSSPSVNDPSAALAGLMVALHLGKQRNLRGLEAGAQLLHGTIGRLNFTHNQGLTRGVLMLSWVP